MAFTHVAPIRRTLRMDLTPSLSVFFPAYNEEANIGRTVRRALEAVARITEDFEIIVVDDGSIDQTARVVEQLAAQEPRVRLIRHPRNLGYGAAIRSGLAAARNDLIFYSDGDGQFDLNELSQTLALLEKAPVIAGYRIKRSDPAHRIFIAKTYRLVIMAVFGLRLRDIDCAWKLLRRQVLDGIELESSGAFISSELLIKLRRKKVPIVEIGVHHYPRMAGVSKGATPMVILRTIRDVIRLRLGLPLKM